MRFMDSKKALSALEKALEFQRGNQLDLAEDAYRQAVQLDPACHEAWHGLGTLAIVANKLDQALNFYRQAIELDSTRMEYWVNFGEALRRSGNFEEAVRALYQAHQMAPDNIVAVYNLGLGLLNCRDYGFAKDAFSRAIALSPKNHMAWTNLGVALQKLGHQNEAMECFSRAMSLKPNPISWANYVAMLNFLPLNPEQIANAHRMWGNELEKNHPRMKIGPRAKHSRIRVGYLSGCFDEHAAMQFLIAALRTHDHDRFEIAAYSHGRHRDATMDRVKGLVDIFRNISDINDEQAAAQIVNDEIDILVDIDGHTSHSRIALMARKPAPIGVSWLGYPNTTGLSTVDYRITDGFVDPPGAEVNYSEKLIRLPGAFYCYAPPAHAPEPVYSGDAGFTFGMFNNLIKASRPALDAYAEILSRVPDSKLQIVLPGKKSDVGYNHLLVPFTEKGIAAERVELLELMNYQGYLQAYQRIDVSLDPFPCVGHTTTCDAIWMGAGVVTLAGGDCRSRLSVSVLSNLGLESWIARDVGQYIDIAVKMAGEREALRAGRELRRKQMADSILCDAKGFTAKLEAVYQKMMDDFTA